METNSTPINTEMVYQGIYTLFGGQANPKEKEKAAKWLEEFQKSIYSWTIADELLQQKRDLNSCYFAAQTMRNKILNSFHELPSNTHESLRDSLIVHIGQITSGTDPIIVTQLCLAISDLALQMATWKNPVLSLVELLSQRPESTWPLLEVLTLIPEEIDSRYLRLGANRREQIHRQLESSAPTVMEFLIACLQNYCQRDNLLNKLIKCYNSWITVHAFPLSNFTENPIAQKIFQLLDANDTSGELHESATDCLCTLLQCIEANNNNQNSGHQLLEAQIFNGIIGLENAYHQSVGVEDMDKVINYCRIFTALGEAFLEKMVSNEEQTHYSIKSLDLILMCVGHYDYEVAEITFNLWYRLSEELYQRDNDTLTSYFKSHVERLLTALYKHSQMDADHEGLIDEQDNFNDFRRKVSELIKDVVFIVGSSNCFKQMFLLLQTPSATWESSEAALFVMGNVAKNILPDENEVVPKVVEAILNLPENTHIAFRYTSIMLLGELFEWIENHPESLQSVLNFLLYSLQQKNGLAPAAAAALTSICAGCKQQMTFHISGLIEIARSLDSFQINNELSIGLLKGISIILSRLQRPQLEQAMHEICSFQLHPLARLLENPPAVTKGEQTDPAYWIDRACAIVRHTSPDVRPNEIHPVVKILTDAWPLISQVFEKYQADLRVMERACRFIRYGMRAIGIQGAHLLEPLVKQMVCLYSLYHHSCFLYLGSILVDEFSNHSDECTNGLLQMLKAFIEPTFHMLQVENGMKNNPDTVDDFFRLCSRFIECLPVVFLDSPLVSPIIQCALLACTLDHRDANSSVMKFFCNLLRCGRSTYRLEATKPLVKIIAEQNGEALVINLIHASVFYLHSYMLPDVAEVLRDLKLVQGIEQTEQYLKKALDTLPKENSGGCITATQQQLDEFSTTMLRSETTKSVTLALKDFTRLYR